METALDGFYGLVYIIEGKKNSEPEENNFQMNHKT